MKKLEKWLETTSLWNIYFGGSFVVFIIILSLLCVTSSQLYLSMLVSIILGLIFGMVFPLVIDMGKQSIEFLKIAKPLKERAINCDTKKEFENIQIELYSFYENDKLGKFNIKYLNKINDILKIKEKYMK